MIRRDSFLLLLIVSLCAGVSLYNPLAALVVLFVASATCMVMTKNWNDPGYLLAVLLSFYMIIGGGNFSSYRGEIETDFMQFLLVSTLCLLTGMGVAQIIAAQNMPLPVTTRPSTLLKQDAIYWIGISALPGLVGIAGMLFTLPTLPLLMPSARFLLVPQWQVLIECLFVPMIFSLCAMAEDYEKKIIYKITAIFFLILLSLTGYRGWVIEGIGLATMIWLMATDSKGPKFFGVVFALMISLAIIVALALLRRLLDVDLYAPDESLRVHGAENWPQFFAQIHFAFRESLYTAQTLWQLYNPSIEHPTLFFADLWTLLPGVQLAAGDMLAQAFGHILGGGLTAALPGVLYYDFGSAAFYLLFIAGMMLGWGWKKVEKSHSILFVALYYYAFFSFLHLFHRGALKPTYFIIPILLGLVLCMREGFYRFAHAPYYRGMNDRSAPLPAHPAS